MSKLKKIEGDFAIVVSNGKDESYKDSIVYEKNINKFKTILILFGEQTAFTAGIIPDIEEWLSYSEDYNEIFVKLFNGLGVGASIKNMFDIKVLLDNIKGNETYARIFKKIKESIESQNEHTKRILEEIEYITSGSIDLGNFRVDKYEILVV